MRKINWILVFIVIFSMMQIRFFGTPSLHAEIKKAWVLTDKKLLEPVVARPPQGTELSGDASRITCISTYEKQSKVEKAVIDWKWSLLPERLTPKETLEMTITGLIKEWNTTHYLSGSIQVRLQPFGASCCSLEGSDLGYLKMDLLQGDEVGKERSITTKATVPLFGELKSNNTNRIQVLVKLLQNGSDYQWIYVYEWREFSSNPVSILLTIGSNKAVVNGQNKTLDTPPFIDINRTYVPFRFLGESFGAMVAYKTNSSTKLVANISYQLDNIKINLTINKPEALVNDKKVMLDAPPVIVNKRTMVPVRFVAEQLQASVEWNSKLQQILIGKE
jgi:hypothetical protein